MQPNPFPADGAADPGAFDGGTVDGDFDLSVFTDLLSESGVDDIWSDLPGDVFHDGLLPSTIGVGGPFEVAVDDAWVVEDPFAMPAVDDGGLVGQPMSVLLPWDTDPGWMSTLR